MPRKTGHLDRSEGKAPLSFIAHLMNGLCPQVPVKYCFPTTPPEVTPFTGEEEHGPGHSETQESASEKGHAQALLLRLQGRSL